MKKEIKLGCPMEYEVDNIYHNGLFLRENETNIVFKELEKSNKQKEVIDKIKEILKENIDDEFYINLTNKEKALYKINELLEEIK